MTENPVKITGEFTPDPHVCKFLVGAPLLDDWTLIFKHAGESMGSPLVDALFSVEGVDRVQISGSVVTLTKAQDCTAPWPQLAKAIISAIRSVLDQGVPPIAAAAIQSVAEDSREDVFGLIEELLELQINPALSSHGGYVRLVKVEGLDVFLELGGGCQGCSSSQATLRHGIEAAIREVVPQVREIHDVTDHTAGKNPYYA